jgi:hypothetical protein
MASESSAKGALNTGEPANVSYGNLRKAAILLEGRPSLPS